MAAIPLPHPELLTWDSSKNIKFNTKTAVFGDNYEQVCSVGNSPTTIVWDLVWFCKEIEQVTDIEGALLSAMGMGYLSWTFLDGTNLYFRQDSNYQKPLLTHPLAVSHRWEIKVSLEQIFSTVPSEIPTSLPYQSYISTENNHTRQLTKISSRFDNLYEQVGLQNLNNVYDTYDLQWEGLTLEQASDLTQQLTATQGVYYLTWQPFDESASKNFRIVSDISFRKPGATFTVSCTVKQCFDLIGLAGVEVYTPPSDGISDPLWNYVVFLLKFNGTDGSQVFIDEKGNAISYTGTVNISNTVAQWGGSSCYFHPNILWDSFVSPPYSYSSPITKLICEVYPDIYGKNWCLEGFVLITSYQTYERYIVTAAYDAGGSAGSGNITIEIGADNILHCFGSIDLQYNLSDIAIFPLNTWIHIALIRDGLYINLFVNFIKVASALYIELPQNHPFNFTFGTSASGDGTKCMDSMYLDYWRFTNYYPRYSDNTITISGPFPTS